jgi:hypothetical protein
VKRTSLRKILVLGGDGVSVICSARCWQPRHEVWTTLRQGAAAYARFPELLGEQTLHGVDVRRLQDFGGRGGAAAPRWWSTRSAS